MKRDFSSSGVSQLSDIEWPPSQPNPSSAPALTGAQKRLKDIQDALAGTAPPLPRGSAIVNSASLNKRPSIESQAAPPSKKARQLPPSWTSGDVLSEPSLGSSVNSSRSGSFRSTGAPASSSSSTGPPNPKSKSKIAAVFLSQEQTQILKLVQDGKNVFYTGSAGAHIVFVSSLVANLNRSPVRNREIRSIARDHQDSSQEIRENA